MYCLIWGPQRVNCEKNPSITKAFEKWSKKIPGKCWKHKRRVNSVSNRYLTNSDATLGSWCLILWQNLGNLHRIHIEPCFIHGQKSWTRTHCLSLIRAWMLLGAGCVICSSRTSPCHRKEQSQKEKRRLTGTNKAFSVKFLNFLWFSKTLCIETYSPRFWGVGYRRP